MFHPKHTRSLDKLKQVEYAIYCYTSRALRRPLIPRFQVERLLLFIAIGVALPKLGRICPVASHALFEILDNYVTFIW